MKVHTFALWLVPLIFFLLVGCATTKDVDHLQGQIGDLQQKVDILRGRVTSEMQQNWVNFETSLEAVAAGDQDPQGKYGRGSRAPQQDRQ